MNEISDEVGDGDCFAVLGKLTDSRGALEPQDFSDMGDFARVMDILSELDRRRWVDFDKRVDGDDRLMSAHGVRLSAAGKRALEEAMLKAVDIVTADEPDPTPSSPLIDSLPDIEAKRVARAKFVEALYERSDGNTSKQFDVSDIGRDLGWTRRVTADVVQYLSHEGLIERKGWGGPANITHEGVREVEQLLGSPTEPTSHFPSYNVIHIGGDNYGQVQAGTTASHQTQASPDSAAITAFLTALSDALPSAGLDPPVQILVHTNITVVAEALNADGPDSPIVRRFMPMLRDVAVGVAGNGAFVGLVEAIKHLPMF